MPREPSPHRRRSLARRVASWVALSTLLGLVAFGVVAYLVVVAQEEAEPDAMQEGVDVITREAREEVGLATMIAAPVAVILTVVAAFLLTRRALRPIDSIVQSASTVTARDHHRRLPVPAADDEVRALVLAVNELLTRLETGFAAESRFAADASHELRTPLTVIATELDVALQRPRSSEEWQNAARTCLDETLHLGALVDALLAMARADRGALETLTPVSLRSIVTRAMRVHASQSASREVTLGAGEGAEQDTLVRGDPDALTSAVSNVIENAIEHSPRGGAVIVSWLLSSPDVVVLHVDDEGPGVDPADRERIFEPFGRGAAATADRAEPSSTRVGLGLGLTIARRSIERQGGTICVTTAPSGGARFSITLPVVNE